MSSTNFTWLYLFSAYLLPAFSIATFLSLPPAQNYALLIPIFIIIAHRIIKVSDISTLCLLSLNLSYIIIAASFGATQSIVLLAAYFLFTLNLLLIYNLSKLDNYKIVVYKFFKLFFYINFYYLIYQNITINMGLGGLAMLHSNDPLQVSNSYIPPVYIAPFYRVTGLFNESAPFTFFLMIYSWFLFVSKSDDKITQSLIIFSILIGGSKIGIIYLACLFVVRVFGKLSVLILGIMGSFFIYALYYFRDMLNVLFLGRAGSIYKRYDESLDIFSTTSNIPAISFDFTANSSGSVALDFASIVINNFGFLYLLVLISILLFVGFRLKVCIEHKFLFLSVLGLGLVSNGSILIPQYSILFIFIFYINSINKITIPEVEYQKIIYSHPNL